MSEKITPVILCGGGGTRLWPRSRPERPKPFIDLLGGKTLFARTLARCADPALFTAPVIVAGEGHVPLIREQLPADSDATIIVEPAAKNTAPAIALAAEYLDPDAVMLVCPSDHDIADEAAFRAAALRAGELARAGRLTAFGIAPDRPETGYGYILRGEPLGEGASLIARFVEKPDAERASAFLASGDHVWNGGIFCFRAGTFREELARHRPDMAARVAEAIEGVRADGGLVRPAPAPVAAIKGESVDYAVMENTTQAAMVDVAMGWSDIGNWAAVAERLPTDDAGNHAPGADLNDCSGVTVLSDGPRVSAIGCTDLVIIVDGGDILVLPKSEAQRVGKLPGAKG